MNKTEFINALAEKCDISKKNMHFIVDNATALIEETVASGDVVQIVGFGTFKSAKRAARTGINPQTKEKIKIPKTVVPTFKAGAAFKATVAAGKKKKK